MTAECVEEALNPCGSSLRLDVDVPSEGLHEVANAHAVRLFHHRQSYAGIASFALLLLELEGADIENRAARERCVTYFEREIWARRLGGAGLLGAAGKHAQAAG